MAEKIADTPGFSSLDYEVDKAEDLNAAFPEIAEISRDCKFRTCTHTHEPACAVKPAVEAERIAAFVLKTTCNFSVKSRTVDETYKKTAKKLPK